MFTLTQEIQEKVDKTNGRRRTRTLSESDIREFLDALNSASEEVHTIRKYSGEGFVPNSYRYRAEISVIEANRIEGEWQIGAFTIDAKRSHGNGALLTINGRAA